MALAAAFMFPWNALADSEDKPVLDLNPASIGAVTILDDSDLVAQLRLRAPADKALQDIELSSFSNDGISVTVQGQPESQRLDSLRAGSEHVWSLQLKPTRIMLKAGQVVFQVAFTLADTTQPPKRQHLYATLGVEAAAPETASSLATFEIKGTVPVLSRERPGTLHLILHNKQSRELALAELNWFAPDFVDLVQNGHSCPEQGSGEASNLPMRLAPWDSLVIPVLVCPRPEIVPGKYTLVTTARLQVAGINVGTLSASQEVEIGVLGASDLLKVLGVPSLLLLPGFLLIVTWRILYRQSESAASNPMLDPTKVDFWAVAVALSLGFSFAYPWVTGLLLSDGPRNYLLAYGLRDLVYVYTGAIAVGVVTFLIGRLIGALRNAHAAAETEKLVPSDHDEALQFVGKLGKARLTLHLPLASLNEDPTLELFVLEPWLTDDAARLATPILITLNEPIADQDAKAQAGNDLQKILNDPDLDAAAAFEILQNGIWRRWWRLDWASVGGAQGPTTREPDSITLLNRREQIVKESS